MTDDIKYGDVFRDLQDGEVVMNVSVTGSTGWGTHSALVIVAREGQADPEDEVGHVYQRDLTSPRWERLNG